MSTHNTRNRYNARNTCNSAAVPTGLLRPLHPLHTPTPIAHDTSARDSVKQRGARTGNAVTSPGKEEDTHP